MKEEINVFMRIKLRWPRKIPQNDCADQRRRQGYVLAHSHNRIYTGGIIKIKNKGYLLHDWNTDFNICSSPDNNSEEMASN